MSESYPMMGLMVVKILNEHIKKYADIFGLSPEVIAGAIAEEWAYNDIIQDMVASLSIETDKNGRATQSAHDKIKNAYINNEGSVWGRPVGAASIVISTAIGLLTDYLNSIRVNGVVDLSQDKLNLAQYENNYGQLCLDLIDGRGTISIGEPDQAEYSLPTTVIFTGLMLKQGENFFSNLPVYGTSWKLLTPQLRDGVLITYFNIGSHIKVASPAGPFTKIKGLFADDKNKTYFFPTYFPKPGSGDSGGQVFIDDQKTLLEYLYPEETASQIENRLQAIEKELLDIIAVRLISNKKVQNLNELCYESVA